MASIHDRYLILDHSLLSKPKVLFMRSERGWSELEIAGAITLWFTHVSQVQRERLEYTSRKAVDEIAHLDGFAEAMESVGWVRFEGTDCVIVDFDDRFSVAAKRRANEAIRRSENRGDRKSLSDKECRIPPNSAEFCPQKRRFFSATQQNNKQNTTPQNTTGHDNDRTGGPADAGAPSVVVPPNRVSVGEVADRVESREGPLTSEDRAEIGEALTLVGVSGRVAKQIAADPDLGREQACWALRESLNAEKPPAWITQAMREHWNPPSRGSPSSSIERAHNDKRSAVERIMREVDG